MSDNTPYEYETGRWACTRNWFGECDPKTCKHSTYNKRADIFDCDIAAEYYEYPNKPKRYRPKYRPVCYCNLKTRYCNPKAGAEVDAIPGDGAAETEQPRIVPDHSDL